MTFVEFEQAAPTMLRDRARQCFDLASHPRTLNEVQIAKLLEAQFYMQELDRRSGGRIALRDLVLEIVVIVLIGVEIILAVKQGKDEDILMDKQNGILTTLQKSTADNAASISALAIVTKAMSDATTASGKTLTSVSKGVQDQISIFYDPSVSLMYQTDQNRIFFNNTGRSTVNINTIKVDGQLEEHSGNQKPIRC